MQPYQGPNIKAIQTYLDNHTTMCTCTLLGHSYLDLFFISITIALIINATRDWVADDVWCMYLHEVNACTCKTQTACMCTQKKIACNMQHAFSFWLVCTVGLIWWKSVDSYSRVVLQSIFLIVTILTTAHKNALHFLLVDLSSHK